MASSARVVKSPRTLLDVEFGLEVWLVVYHPSAGFWSNARR